MEIGPENLYVDIGVELTCISFIACGKARSLQAEVSQGEGSIRLLTSRL